METSSGQSIEKNAGGKGTGGTDLMHFLKPIRDNCNNTKVLQASLRTTINGNTS